MKTIIIALTVFAAMTVPFGVSAAGAAEPIYTVSAHFLLLADEEITILPRSGKNAHPQLRLGETVLELGPELLWDGSPNRPDSINILSSPRVQTKNAHKAILRTGMPGGVQYFEKTSDNCYELHSLPNLVRSFIQFEVTPTQAPPDDDGDSQVDVDWTFHASLIGERKALPGVSLDVGEPTVVKIDNSAFTRWRTGRWDIFSAHLAKRLEPGGKDVLMILLRFDER